MCSWKGQASYHTLFVDGDANPDAVWTYPEPKDAAANIKGRHGLLEGRAGRCSPTPCSG
jgi:uncharacterized protein (DUF427 family)